MKFAEGENLILEVALLDEKPGEESDFEEAFGHAQSIIESMGGYLGHELQRCLENPSRYILLVRWQTLCDHTVGFRESREYLEWKRLLHHFYDPFPTVEHFQQVKLG